MIVTRTPLRIPLGGGGTDLPSFYETYGGDLVTAAIHKYVWITVNRRFESDIRVSYSKTEIVDDIDDIEHPIVRESLRLLGLGPGLEIVSVADIPANTGLGSSSSFTVGLLHALHTFKRDAVGSQQLAEEAFKVEHDILGEPIGKQDQYAASYGGIIRMEIDAEGGVAVDRLNIQEHVIQELENTVCLFYTGIQRSASTVLAHQEKAIEVGEEIVTQCMQNIKSIGRQIAMSIADGDLYRFGELLDEHWHEKKKMSSSISSPDIDRWYTVAKDHGAVGGKVMGAGGGGFFMLYVESQNKNQLRKSLTDLGLRPIRFAIDYGGSRIVGNF